MLTFHYRPVYTVPIVTWANGTYEEIYNMIEANDNGDINLGDYWSVGDERAVSLSQIVVGNKATALYQYQGPQDVVYVLMDTGAVSGYKDINNKTVNFVWGQKNLLNNICRMNSSDTNTGSWDSCPMRSDLNNYYYNAIPSGFKNCLKQFKVITAQSYNGSTNTTSNDYISMFAEKEVTNGSSYSNATEAAALKQIDYYKTSAHRVKQKVSASGAGETGSDPYNFYWYLRSPYKSNNTSFCYIGTTGDAYYDTASTPRDVAPFGCI